MHERLQHDENRGSFASRKKDSDCRRQCGSTALFFRFLLPFRLDRHFSFVFYMHIYMFLKSSVLSASSCRSIVAMVFTYLLKQRLCAFCRQSNDVTSRTQTSGWREVCGHVPYQVYVVSTCRQKRTCHWSSVPDDVWLLFFSLSTFNLDTHYHKTMTVCTLFLVSGVN